MKLINLQFCQKMDTHKSLFINAFKISLITCLSKGYKLLLYLKKNKNCLKMSQIVKTRLIKNMNKHTKFCKLRVILQTCNRFQRFCFKDFVPETLLSSLIYKFSCRSCTASYIGKTYRHFK